MNKVIRIGVGLDSLKFGAEMEDVAKLFGDPEKIVNNGEPPNGSTAWHYWRCGYSAYFEENVNYVFSSISTEDRNVMLFEKRIFDLDIEEIQNLFLGNGFSEFCEETGDDQRVELVIRDAACIAFFNEDRSLRTFDWFTFTDDDTDKTIWPK